MIFNTMVENCPEPETLEKSALFTMGAERPPNKSHKACGIPWGILGQTCYFGWRDGFLSVPSVLDRVTGDWGSHLGKVGVYEYDNVLYEALLDHVEERSAFLNRVLFETPLDIGD